MSDKKRGNPGMIKGKNVVLVTLFDDNNIGNRLQNYALQHILTKYGANVTTLNNGYTSIPNWKDRLKIKIKKSLGKLGVQKYKEDCICFDGNNIKRNANKQFDECNIKHIVNITNREAFQHNWSQYNIAITGSDQVWHKWRKDVYELPFYYLEFMPCDKRISYAASFGFESIPFEDLEQHKKGLNGMTMISCRESAGCEIVKNIIGREVPRVLDPTLLLDEFEWRKIAEQAQSNVKCQSNYAFIYFLGEITVEYKKFIDETLSSLGITKVINFSDNINMDISMSGPSGFLSMIDNADYIFTDSFHCTVFSVIFNKHFHVFRRVQPGFERMFGRIEDLLASKGLLNHIYGGTSVKASNDFAIIYKQSIDYLKKAMEIH